MSELVTKNCPVCFIDYAIPKAMNDKRRAEGGNWFCPNGHSLHVSETTTDKLTRERDQLKQRVAEWQDYERQASERAEAAERRASAARGQVTRLKNRAANGVCPCCNLTFANLQRHMASKHAGFLAEEVQAEAGQTIQ